MKPQTALFSATRRAFLRRAGLLALASGALSGLSACGFKLRGPQTFAFESLRMAGSEATPVAVALRRSTVRNAFAAAGGRQTPSPIFVVRADSGRSVAG